MEAIASLIRPSIADSKPTVILSYLIWWALSLLFHKPDDGA
jgi:hypothetical protein